MDWGLVGVALAIVWVVASFAAVAPLQDRIFFRHYLTRPHPAKADVSSVGAIAVATESLLGMVTPGAGRVWRQRAARTRVLHQGLENADLDRRRALAWLVEPLSLVVSILGATAILMLVSGFGT